MKQPLIMSSRSSGVLDIRVVPDLAAQKRELRRLTTQVDTGARFENVFILTVELFQKLFSAERLRILLALREGENITALARRLGRPFETVHRDLQLLASYGFLQLTKQGRNVFPQRNGRLRLVL